MINREDFYMIHQLRQEGCFLVDIADKMNCSVKTVQRQLKRVQPPSLRKRTVHKPRKLDPFKSTVDDMLANNIWNAMVIFDRIVSLGYTGKIPFSVNTFILNGRCAQARQRFVMRPMRDSSYNTTGANWRWRSVVNFVRSIYPSIRWDLTSGPTGTAFRPG